ncbi:unnamed protein product, partial [Laminaria digitata]
MAGISPIVSTPHAPPSPTSESPGSNTAINANDGYPPNPSSTASVFNQRRVSGPPQQGDTRPAMACENDETASERRRQVGRGHDACIPGPAAGQNAAVAAAAAAAGVAGEAAETESTRPARSLDGATCGEPAYPPHYPHRHHHHDPQSNPSSGPSRNRYGRAETSDRGERSSVRMEGSPVGGNQEWTWDPRGVHVSASGSGSGSGSGGGSVSGSAAGFPVVERDTGRGGGFRQPPPQAEERYSPSPCCSFGNVSGTGAAVNASGGVDDGAGVGEAAHLWSLKALGGGEEEGIGLFGAEMRIDYPDNAA